MSTTIDPEALERVQHMTAWPEISSRVGHPLDLHLYQVESAIQVVDRLQGRAILADEVGLGKTIEAGLIIAELRARGLVDRVLILVPAGLKSQWENELRNKFGWEPMQSARDAGWIWVLSIDWAKRFPYYNQLQYVSWDLVIVDEAHHLKNPRTLNYQLVAGLSATYLLLLTATPMENQLTELYSLVNLVKPGLFGPYLRFYRQFILDKRTPKNAAELRKLLSQVMIRHQRQEVGYHFQPRDVTLWPIRLDPGERQLYDTLTHALKQEYRHRLGDNQTILPLITLQRELCSSPHALLPTLRQATWLGPLQAQLIELAESIHGTAKVHAVLELVSRVSGKFLIFTEFRATQELLVRELTASGFEARAFHGGLRARERDAVVEWFREGDRILVSTEAGGQGINLQFCHQLINFDLPWNPMRIEQRIGRVHRIGQQFPVSIFNLFTIGTVEEDILHLLHEKIDLFRKVVGELDVILRHLERRGSLESRLMDIFFWEEEQDQVRSRIDSLANEFLAARRRLSWPEPVLPQSTTGAPETQSLH